jgi:fructosamine-3-kinase
VADVAAVIESILGGSVEQITPLGGGDVADAYRAVLTDSIVFAKTKRDAPAGFFTTEARGLAWLRDSATVRVPEVLAVSDEPPLLVLEWVEPGWGNQHTDEEFGRELSALHASGAPVFGREDRRSTGSRGLPNEPCATWAEFYATQRLEPLARLAAEARALPADAIRRLEMVAARIGDLAGPDEPPARLHGDLWGGNRLIGSDGASWLIDPAAIGGHREFDLRIALHHLAPLVVHAIKFGSAYVGPTIDALGALD